MNSCKGKTLIPFCTNKTPDLEFPETPEDLQAKVIFPTSTQVLISSSTHKPTTRPRFYKFRMIISLILTSDFSPGEVFPKLTCGQCRSASYQVSFFAYGPYSPG